MTTTHQSSASVGAHATTHQPSGADAMAVDAAAGTGSLRTLGTGAAQAATGNHAHADISAGVQNSAVQSITSGVTAVITYDTERWDTDNIHSLVTNTGRLTCVTAGKYIITARVIWAANATGKRFAQIVLNNAASVAESHIDIDSAIAHSHCLACILNLVVNDYVDVQVTQDSGGALNVAIGDGSTPSFSMARLPG